MPGVVLIVSIPDICLLPHFLYSHEYRLTRNTVYCAILSDQMVVGCPLGVPISYYFSILHGQAHDGLFSSHFSKVFCRNIKN